MTMLLLRIAMVLIAAASGGITPCAGNHHASAQVNGGATLLSRGLFEWHKMCSSRYDADAGNAR